MKFYYINLDSSKDRRNFMESQFDKMGITNYERIPAVSIKTVDNFVHTDHDLIDGEYVCDPTPEKKFFPNCTDCKVERAVLQSHLRAIERGYENGDDFFVILEDDTVLPYDIDFEKLVNEFSPKDWECLQLLCSNPLTVKKLFEIFQKHTTLFVKWQMILPSCGFYLVKREGAKKIIDKYKINGKWKLKDTGFCMLSDAMLYQIMRTYIITVPLSYMNIDLGSLVHPEHLKSHEYGSQMIKQIIYNANLEKLPFIKKKIQIE